MKTSYLRLGLPAIFLLVSWGPVLGQSVAPNQEIVQALHRYLAAMADRDVNGLQSVLDKHFLAIEAAETRAEVHRVNTSDGPALLPPAGNQDWNRENIKLSRVDVTVSPTHPSVAMAAFNLTFPLSDQRVTQLKETLAQLPAGIEVSRRLALEAMIENRAIDNAMFAMLAQNEGQWRIVSMSFPK